MDKHLINMGSTFLVRLEVVTCPGPKTDDLAIFLTLNVHDVAWQLITNDVIAFVEMLVYTGRHDGENPPSISWTIISF